MRSFAALITALVVSSAAIAAAQTPAPSQPQPAPSQPAPAQPAQPAQPHGRVFGSDAGVIFNQVKADKTADFEFAMGKIKEALLKATDPVRKQQAASWKVFKAAEANDALWSLERLVPIEIAPTVAAAIPLGGVFALLLSGFVWWLRFRSGG